ncbi:sodium:proton antiporter [Enterococcus silesiacus]|uniref:Sodium:proton antiporter n=1 Tax=Enterococcus silesiacus TaxID=332949 RepID=A0A0S3KDB0_9ENTE|nr:flavin reductase [Enterococcus silesiacus]ALS02294.1 sodium:proton antiporter [Enterococcus silesiacus]OJG92341.1 hypothetical protein RV15_GL003134 [Enterococcus silesiacus]
MYKQLNKNSFYYGFPVVLMTTRNKDTGSDDLTPISSTWTLDRSVVLGLGLDNQGFHNLKVGSDLTLNIADQSIWEQIEKIDKKTGNPTVPEYKKQLGYDYCENKFRLAKFSKLAGISVSTARIAECLIQIEACVTDIMVRKNYAIIETTVQAIHVSEEILADETHIDVEKWHPLIYKFREYATTDKHLGKNFRFQEFLK